MIFLFKMNENVLFLAKNINLISIIHGFLLIIFQEIIIIIINYIFLPIIQKCFHKFFALVLKSKVYS